MATEVITRKLCDLHAVNGEKVEADDVVQFAYDGVVREVDACTDCKKEHEARYEPLVEVSRVVKKRRKPRSESGADTAETTDADKESPVTGMAAG